jgi:hypothetical protein
MPADQQESYSILTSPTQPPGVFGTKIPSTVTFAIGLFLFILPFAELKCKLTDQKQNSLINLSRYNLAFTNTGLGLAFGNDWKLNIPMPSGGIFENDETTSWKKSAKSQKPNTYAIVALAMAVVGLGLAFMNPTPFAVVTTVAGAISAGALIGLMIDLNKKSKDIISEIQKAGNGISLDSAGTLKLNFTPWFYITIITMLAAAVFSYMRILSVKRQT